MPELLLGGQAVIEGVMMRTQTDYSVAVRKPNGKIIVKKEKIKQRSGKLKLPFLRGSVVLYDTLILGMRALMFSAKESSEEKENIGGKELFIMFIFAGILAVGLFVVLPLAVAALTAYNRTFLFNIVDGVVRVLVFIAYLLVISSFNDVKRMFAYHGAEHMTIHAYEHKKKLTTSNVRKFMTMHPRCGTSFLLIVLMVSVLVFSFVTHPNFLVKFLSRLLLIPLIAGVSYEILRFSARFSNTLVGRILTYPGIALQKITTKQPDKSQIEVAITALKAVLSARAPSR